MQSEHETPWGSRAQLGCFQSDLMLLECKLAVQKLRLWFSLGKGGGYATLGEVLEMTDY